MKTKTNIKTLKYKYKSKINVGGGVYAEYCKNLIKHTNTKTNTNTKTKNNTFRHLRPKNEYDISSMLSKIFSFEECSKKNTKKYCNENNILSDFAHSIKTEITNNPIQTNLYHIVIAKIK